MRKCSPVARATTRTRREGRGEGGGLRGVQPLAAAAQGAAERVRGEGRRQQRAGGGRARFVSREAHYTKTYNALMRERFAYRDEESSSSDEEEQQVGRKRARTEREEERHIRRRDKDYDRRQRPECFLCAWGNRFHDGIEARHVNRLHDIINEQYGICSNVELAEMLVLYFNKEVYRPGCGMTRLTREVALEHIEEGHSLNARIFLGESIRRQGQNLFCLEAAQWREDGTYDKIAVQEARRRRSCSANSF